jgi:N-acetylglucosaminyl-diphospho-decaprenol L-rhamnosyltransferase
MADVIDVSVIIVSYNTAELTLECIHSIYRETKELRFEIIVVDNASKDDSAELIESEFSDIRLIKLSYNAGFAEANNIAGHSAKGSFILLLNPDTVILDGAIDKIVLFAKDNPGFGLYGGSTFFGDLKRNPTSGYKKTTWWSLLCTVVGLSVLFRKSRFFSSESLAWWDWSKPKIVDIVTGCFLLIHYELWNELGGFDTRFHMYAEDADLSIRVNSLGKKCILYPDAKIIHYGGSSENVSYMKLIRLLKAKAQLYRKHWQGLDKKYAIIMLNLWAWTRYMSFKILSPYNNSFRVKYNMWKNVWNRRNEWSI